MVTAYYTETGRQWDSEELERKLQLLPIQMKQRILRYSDWQQQQLRICGKLLLQRLLFDLNSGKTLGEIQYDEWNKPYLPGALQFNIAHSGNIAICVVTNYGPIGIDIEKVKNVEIGEMQDYFTANEWEWLQKSNNKNDAFYYLWVRKESLIKAVGRGVEIPFSSVGVLNNEVIFDGISFFLHTVNLEVDYKVSISKKLKINNLEFIKISEKVLG